MLDLCCCTDFSLFAGSRVYYLVVWGLLTVVASPFVRHKVQGTQALGAVARGLRMSSVVVVPRLQSTGLAAVVHGLSCSVACGTFLHQGSNLGLLHWQVEGRPLYFMFYTNFLLFFFLQLSHRLYLTCTTYSSLLLFIYLFTFIMLCWFLLSNNSNQPNHTYIALFFIPFPCSTFWWSCVSFFCGLPSL